MTQAPEAKEGPSARKPSAKSGRTRQRIIDAAAEIMASRGYASAQLADIAALADVQSPSIYYYFGSREELMAEVIWVGMRDVRREVSAALGALPEDADPIDSIVAASAAHLRRVLTSSTYTRASVRNAGQMPAELAEKYRREVDAYGQEWARLFRAAEDQGALPAGLNGTFARMLVLGALNWASEWWDQDRGSVEDLLDTVHTLINTGLRGPRPRGI